MLQMTPHLHVLVAEVQWSGDVGVVQVAPSSDDDVAAVLARLLRRARKDFADADAAWPAESGRRLVPLRLFTEAATSGREADPLGATEPTVGLEPVDSNRHGAVEELPRDLGRAEGVSPTVKVIRGETERVRGRRPLKEPAAVCFRRWTRRERAHPRGEPTSRIDLEIPAVVGEEEAAVEHSNTAGTPDKTTIRASEEQKFLGAGRGAPEPVHGVRRQRMCHGRWGCAPQQQESHEPLHGVLSHARSIVSSVAQPVSSLQITG
ncbi:MAG: hypothetical protein Q8N26_25350 [Myxococcales bacterium]|nr:hypothetical protein [Myxococcales bacterium]